MSIVIPVYNNDARTLNDLYQALVQVLDGLAERSEVIFVDDGSTDETLEALHDLHRRDARVRVVELAANFGQHAALSAGFDVSRGAYIVTMDADLQVDPRDIPRLLQPLRDGYDLVSGVRLRRQDPPFRRLASLVITRLVANMTGVRLRDIGCPLNACTREVGKSLAAFGELRRFLKPMAVRVARRVTEVEITHRPRPRHRPRSTYSATGLLRLFMDFLVNSLGDVFAWVFAIGGALTVALVAATAVLLLAAFFGIASAGAVTPLVFVSIGAGLVTLFALAGDYVQRIYRQSSGRPFYLIRRLVERDE